MLSYNDHLPEKFPSQFEDEAAGARRAREPESVDIVESQLTGIELAVICLS